MQKTYPLFWAGSSLKFLFTGGELHLMLAADFGRIEPWIAMELNGAPQLRVPLDADFCAISQSGWGICCGWEGGRGHSLPQWYRETRFMRTREPDAVVINFGYERCRRYPGGIAGHSAA